MLLCKAILYKKKHTHNLHYKEKYIACKQTYHIDKATVLLKITIHEYNKICNCIHGFYLAEEVLMKIEIKCYLIYVVLLQNFHFKYGAFFFI